MSTDPKVTDLLAPMRDRPVDTSSRRFKVDREKVLSRMIQASALPEREPSRRFGLYGALALAAGLAMVAGSSAYKALRPAPVATQTAPRLEVVAVQGEVVRIEGSTRAGIAPGQATEIAASGTIETAAHAGARLKTPSGLDIELRENTRVRLTEMNPSEARFALHLEAGAVRCVVPHLEQGRTFSVVTPDARVVDRGTIFTVDVEGDGAAAKTVVRVEEGQVLVQHDAGETPVGATQSWSTPDVEPPAPVVATAVEPPARAPAASGPRRAPEPKLLRGTLAEETSLLNAGLASERKGDLGAAATSFESLLSRYPGSPLAPEARAALARVKGGTER
jgi:TolA-binding protein